MTWEFDARCEQTGRVVRRRVYEVRAGLLLPPIFEVPASSKLELFAVDGGARRRTVETRLQRERISSRFATAARTSGAVDSARSVGSDERDRF